MSDLSQQERSFAPGPRPGTVLTSDRQVISVPAGWALLPPGDPGVTRRVKKAGPSWTVSEKRGRKVFSLGVWAPAETITRVKQELAREREDPSYEKKLAAGRKRRAAEQGQYAEDFTRATYEFLAFSPRHEALAQVLAQAIAAHAVPVGSGTVARTKRIPIEQRAESATIAWLRHATTGYDNMEIPRVKGMRREVRRMLAERSRQLLARYRRGEDIAAEGCLLRRGLRARSPQLQASVPVD